MHRRRQEEDEEEERKVDEYREIGLWLKNYPDEELRKAKKLVSSFIRSAEEVEEVFLNHVLAQMSALCTFLNYNCIKEKTSSYMTVNDLGHD